MLGRAPSRAATAHSARSARLAPHKSCPECRYLGEALNRADRLANLGLFGLAIVAWGFVIYVLTTYSPNEGAAALLSGALLLGAAIGLTLAPLFWLATFVRSNHIAYRGSWWR